MYKEYSKYEKDIKLVLSEFKSLIKEYIANKNLLDVSFTNLDEIAINVSTLDYKLVSLDGFYMEQADVWLSILCGYYEILKEEQKYGKK